MKRILSIQSHVVSGYVGNKAATFPLQTLGYDVDAINTVQFSNHTGYNTWQGDRTPPTTVLNLFQGLQANGLVNYSHLLTGYMGNAESIEAVETILRQLRQINPSTFYGDNGHLYVSEEMIPLYKQRLLPYANLITPNQFELELLTEMPARTQAGVLAAMDKLHTLGVNAIVVTSAELDDLRPASASSVPFLYLYGSQRLPDTSIAVTSTNSGPITLSAAPQYERFRIGFPRLDGYFTGTGDLCCALLLAHFAASTKESLAGTASMNLDQPFAAPLPGVLPRACEQTMATMAAVMERTLAAQRHAGIVYEPNLPRSERPSELVRHCELQLIQSKADIEHPVIKYRAERL
ncbi:putative pyridoxal kinase [Dimargaris verticillata]|uniref:pyridoxal kinase n=1 Tax=Dimargaris verticillata TaxID=2761393 RepID=A0A9W8B1U3_9FUNG|nr:putative pyridoxal kinase [Dimargaris verticillata]